MKEYKKPELILEEIDLTSFLCVSIGKMEMTIEVDEYANTGEEGLTFDED